MWQSFDELPFLIAEDAEDDLILLQRAVRRAGVPNPHAITTTGVETIAYLKTAGGLAANEHPFPVILFLDLLMPQVDGIEVLKWLRDNPHPPIAIVLHTGVDDEELLQRARELGAMFYLPKGARPEAIREVFRRARSEWKQYQLVQH
jgi:CheY-like chemotaxis protein